MGNIFGCLGIFVVESKRNFLRVKKVKLAIARILLSLQTPQLSKLL